MFVQSRPQSHQKSQWRLLSTVFPLQLRTYLGEMADGNEIVADLEKDGVNTGVGLVKSGAGKAVSGAFDVAKDESRKVAIKLTNNTKQPWKNPRIFLDSGAAEDILPLEIANEKEVEYEVHKKKWTFSGIAGVITYQWKDSGKKYSLALMFRSPMISSNSWNVVINSENVVEANLQTYKELLQVNGDNPVIKGDNNYTTREFGPFTVQGAMSSSGTAKINLIVSCTEPEESGKTNTESA